MHPLDGLLVGRRRWLVLHDFDDDVLALELVVLDGLLAPAVDVGRMALDLYAPRTI